MTLDIFETFSRERAVLLDEYRKAQIRGDGETVKIVLGELYNSSFNYHFELGKILNNFEKLKQLHPDAKAEIEKIGYSVYRQREEVSKGLNDFALEISNSEFRGE